MTTLGSWMCWMLLLGWTHTVSAFQASSRPLLRPPSFVAATVSVPPSSSSTLSQQLRQLGKAGEPDQAWELLLQQQQSNNADVTEDCWVQVLLAYQHDVDKVLELLQVMKDDAVVPITTASYNALLQAHRNAGNAAAAEQVVYDMLRHHDNDDASRPNAHTFVLVLQALGSLSKSKRTKTTKTTTAAKVQQWTQLAAAVGALDAAVLRQALHVTARHCPRCTQKASKAQELYCRLVDTSDIPPALLDQLQQDVLAACAYTPATAPPDDLWAAYQIATHLYDHEMPNEIPMICHIHMLRTCAHWWNHPVSIENSDSDSNRLAILQGIWARATTTNGTITPSLLRALARHHPRLQLALLGTLVEEHAAWSL